MSGAIALYTPTGTPIIGRDAVVDVEPGASPPRARAQVTLDDASAEILEEDAVFDGFELPKDTDPLDELTVRLTLRLRPEVAAAHAELVRAAAADPDSLLTVTAEGERLPALARVGDWDLEEWTIRIEESELGRRYPPGSERGL